MKGIRRIICAAVAAINLAASVNVAADRDFSLGFSSMTPLIDGTTMEVFEEFRSRTLEEMKIVEKYIPQGKHEIFVSPSGKAGNPGTVDKPVATLKQAIKIAENLDDRRGGVVIWLREGEYSFSAPQLISEKSSGKDGEPFFISAYKDEKVTFYGGQEEKRKSTSADSFTRGRERLPESVVSKVRAIDMSGAAINYGLTEDGGEPTVEIDGLSYNIARWPNNGYTEFAKYPSASGVVEPGDGLPDYQYTNKGVDYFEFAMTTYRPLEWENTGDIWIYGRFRTEYLWARRKVDSFNEDIPSCRTASASHEGAGYTGYNKYYFYNVLEELDTPGEYFYDKNENVLYYYPYEESENNEQAVFMPSTLDSILDVEDAHNLVINGINFIGGNTGVMLLGEKNVIQNCTFSGQGYAGVHLYGEESGVIYSEFYDCDTGIFLRQNRYSPYKNENSEYRVTPTRNFVQNNYFERNTQRGVHCTGQVQSVISHNVFNAFRSTSVQTSNGNFDTIMEYNESVGVGTGIADGGDFYNGGLYNRRRLTARYNYIRGFNTPGSSVIGIYWDDMSARDFSYGNILIDKCFHLHTTSHETIFNNIIIGIERKDLASVRNSNNYHNIGYSQYEASVVNKNQKGENNYSKLTNEFYRQLDYELNAKLDRLRTIRLERQQGKTSNTRSETEDYDSAPKENAVVANILYNRPLPVPVSSEVGQVYEDNVLIKNKDDFTDPDSFDFTLKDNAEIYKKYGVGKMPLIDKFGIVGTKKEEIEVPRLLIPVQSAESTVENINLKWKPARGATLYRITVAKDKDFKEIVNEETVSAANSSYNIDKLNYDTEYFWKVEAISWSNYFGKGQSSSEVHSFKTYSRKENALHSDVDTYPLQYLINEYKTMASEITEEDGAEHETGVYKQGTKNKIIERAEESRSKINSISLASQLDAETESLKKDIIDILTENAVPFTRKLGIFRPEDWNNSNAAIPVTFAKDATSLSFAAAEGGGSTMLMNKAKLTPKEGVEFRFRFDDDINSTAWPAISLKAYDSLITSPYGADGYYVVIKKDIIELQKFKSIVCTVPNDGAIPFKQWCDIYFITENTDEGMHIVLKCDDKTVIDYTDTENPYNEPGYFGFKHQQDHPGFTVAACE